MDVDAEGRKIGQRIAQARADKDGMSRELLAGLVGISVPTLRRYEAGTNEVPAIIVLRIAWATDKAFGWFAGAEIPVRRQLDQALAATLLAELEGWRSRLDRFERDLEVAIAGDAEVGTADSAARAAQRNVRRLHRRGEPGE